MARRMLCLFLVLRLSASVSAQESNEQWELKDGVYRRTVPVQVIRHAGGNNTAYQLELETGGEVLVSEINGGRGTSLYHQLFGSLEVRKDDQGAADSYMVTLGELSYADLNGDGLIDAMSDSRAVRYDHALRYGVPVASPKHYIRFQGSFIEVRGGRVGIRSKGATSVEGDVHFSFEQGEWVAQQSAVQSKNQDNAPHIDVPAALLEPSVAVRPRDGAASQPTLQPPTSKDREELIAQWRELFAPVSIDDDVFSHLVLVRPQPKDVFQEFQGKTLSADLVRSSRSWMTRFLREEANPYATAYLSPHQPAKYYLAPEDGLSLLWYELDCQGYHIQMQESNAAVLIQIRPRSAPNFAEGLPGEQLQAALDAVLNANRDDGRSRPRPFLLPARLLPGTVFWNTAEPRLNSQGGSLQPDWKDETVGFVTEGAICLVLRKAHMVHGAPSPGSSIWAIPDPQWLRGDLFERKHRK